MRTYSAMCFSFHSGSLTAGGRGLAWGCGVVGVLLLAAVLVLSPQPAAAFDYIEIPEDCNVIDEMNPFPDLREWTLVSDEEMAYMQDDGVTMCRRKAFALEDRPNDRLFVVYFKGKPAYWWKVTRESEGPEEASLADMIGSGGGKKEPTNPSKASDFLSQKRKQQDGMKVNIGIMNF